jgi:Trk-type K+ transport system membrane component
MEIFFAGIFGIVIGLAALALARPREAVGSALLPALGGIVALAWWVIATWGAALATPTSSIDSATAPACVRSLFAWRMTTLML